MGKEAACDARSERASGPVKAHLDGERLRLSGAIRLGVLVAEVGHVEVRGDALTFSVKGERIALELGAKVAAAWAGAILHPKSLMEKLELRPGQRVCSLGLSEPFVQDVANATGETPGSVLRGTFDAIFCAIGDASDLNRIAQCRKHLLPAGALWLVSQKGKNAPVHEHVVRAAIIDAGLVDTKVVSFSATHTAAKAVIPVAARVRA